MDGAQIWPDQDHITRSKGQLIDIALCIAHDLLVSARCILPCLKAQVLSQVEQEARLVAGLIVTGPPEVRSVSANEVVERTTVLLLCDWKLDLHQD